MRKLFLLATLLFTFIAFGQAQDSDAQYWDGIVYFQLKPELNLRLQPYDRSNSNGRAIPQDYREFPAIQSLLARHEVRSMDVAFHGLNSREVRNIYRLDFDDHREVEDVLRTLQSSDRIAFAERAPKNYSFALPNDPGVEQLWFLETIEAEAGWNLANPQREVVVAVVDDAVNVEHEDLAGNAWRNTAEVNGSPGVDDDGNGYIDDFIGWDGAMNDNNPNPPANATDQYFAHGTHVAGTVGAVSNNGRGIASIALNSAKVIACKGARDSDGAFTGIWEAFAYAMANNPDIINNSWGRGVDQNGNPPPPLAQFERALLDEAFQRGIIVLFAAGNENNSIAWPGAYERVIGVAATGNANTGGLDEKASYSNFAQWVDISAPGTQVVSLSPGPSRYIPLSGTSMACPNTASLLALMMAQAPNLSREQIVNCLFSSTDNIDAVNPNFVGLLGVGRINVRKAIECVSGNTAPTCAAPSGLAVSNLTGSTATLNWNTVSAASGYNVEIRAVGNPNWFSFPDNPFANNTLNISGLSEGTQYEFRVQSVCGQTSSSFSSPFQFTTSGGGNNPGGNACVSFNDLYTNFATGGDCNNTPITGDFQVWTNEAYRVDACVPGQTYTFSICNGYDANTWRAKLTAALLDQNDAPTDVLATVDGCELSFTIPANLANPVNVIVVVADADDCGGATRQIDNGTPTFSCTQGGGSCAPPGSLRVDNLTNNEGELAWDAAGGGDSYTVQARAVGEQEWLEAVGITGTSIPITGLLPCTEYEFRVRSQCGSDQSAFSPVFRFTTTGCETSCPAPTNISAAVNGRQATISWTADNSLSGIRVNYRNRGAPTWLSRSTTNSSVLLDSLTNCLTYEYQVFGVCTNGQEAPSAVDTFDIDCPDCSAPENLRFVAVTPYNATILWDEKPIDLSYIVGARSAGSATWEEAEISGAAAIYSGLDPCSGYEIRVKAVCTSGESDFGPIGQLTTVGCNGPVYCNSQGDNSRFEWIESVQVGSLSNQSGDDFGYRLFEELAIPTLELDGEYNVTLTPGFLDETYLEYWRIWIDLNQDGDFNDENELVFAPNDPTSEPVSGSFLLPTEGSLGQTTMRISMKYFDPETDGDPPLSCTTFNYGEVEDYRINLAPSSNTTNTRDLASEAAAIQVFPNPFRDVLRVKGLLPHHQVRVLDVTGRVVYALTESQGSGPMSLDLPRLASGMYFVEVISGSQAVVRKKVVKK